MKRFLIVLLIATSCAPVYVPNARNSPMFQGAGEVQVAAQLSAGTEAQAAVALTNHVGVMSNFAYVSRTSDEYDNYIRHSFFEGGIGYFENADRISYEVFAGYGRGKGITYDTYDFGTPDDPLKVTGRYQRFFIQPAIGTNHKRIFNWSAVMRLSVVDFTDFETGSQSVQIDADPILFFEPAFIGKLNFGSRLFLNFQAGVSFPRQEIDFDYEPLSLAIGMGLRFGGPQQE
ncbi:MAG TPA: hypothetical protein VFM90_08055 [Cyclobacteriaceae bacterium]|nr:hypothetical protein [Cyclobacteriaceae bacterium]